MSDGFDSIHYKNNEIIFSFKRSSRKSISIRVYPDQSVRVTAPVFSSRRAIRKAVAEKSAWIIRKQREAAARPLRPAPLFETGETFSILGTEYPLSVSAGKPSIRFDNHKIMMSAPMDSTVEYRKKLLLEWYRKRGDEIFAERIKICTETAALIGLMQPPEWRSRKLKRSWGSCSADNRINLNIELISAPPEYIDYVILHEICHIFEHNHSRRYYNLLRKVCPDWKQQRNYLNKHVQMRLI